MKALVLKDLTKTYKNGLVAVKKINLEIEKGDFFGLLGPNGAGKTTTIGMINDLVKKTSGKIKVLGKDFDNEKEKAKSFIGVVPQEFNLSIFDTVIDILILQAGYYGVERKIAVKRAEEYLKLVGLWEKRKERTHFLSGGMKRKLMFIRAIMHDPKIIIFDEPTAGLDIEARRFVWQFMKKLNKEGKTIILTTHYLEEAEQLCKNIAIINKGEIIKNTSVKQLIREMHKETFILDLKKPLKKINLNKKFDYQLIDSHTLEVTIPREDDLNQFFLELEKKKIKVTSMRNKANRLEELFVEMTK